MVRTRAQLRDAPLKRRPPGPKGHWITGNLGAYERDRLAFLLDVHRQFGSVVAFDKRTTLVADPNLIRQVMRSPQVGITHDVLLRPLTSRRYKEMAAAKQLLRPATRKANSSKLAPLVEEGLREALKCQGARLGFDLVAEPVSFLEPVISMAVNTLMFGSTDAVRIAPQVCDLLNDLSRLIGNPLAPPPSWHTPLRKRIEEKHAALSGDVEVVLQARRRSPRVDIASTVAGQPAFDLLPRKSVADMLVGAILASQRVPAAAAAWMLHLIATNPQSQSRLRCDGTGETGAAAADFALAVALESLRLYPATWMLQRQVLEPLTVAGYRFEAGHTVLMSPYVLHRSEQHFDRPDDFVPTRWLASECGPAARAGFMPFGDGLHACPGRHLATRILVAIARTVCVEFEVLERGRGVKADPRTTLLPVGSILRFRTRLP